MLRMADLALLSAYKPNRARRRLGRHYEDRKGIHCPHDVQCLHLSGSGAGAVGHSCLHPRWSKQEPVREQWRCSSWAARTLRASHEGKRSVFRPAVGTCGTLQDCTPAGRLLYQRFVLAEPSQLRLPVSAAGIPDRPLLALCWCSWLNSPMKPTSLQCWPGGNVGHGLYSLARRLCG